MQLPRFRLTVRGMMAAPAILAIALGILAERRARFRGLVARYRASPTSLAPSADGRRMATGGRDGRVRVWGVARVLRP